MTIKIMCDNKSIPVNMLEFSDGALTCKLEELPENPRYISVHVLPSTPVYRVREELEIVLDAIHLNTTGYGKMYINIDYLPYARADRKFEDGNGIPLLNFLDWVRGKYNTKVCINICDIHNPKTLDKYSYINNKTQLQCFKESIAFDFKTNYDYIVAPDKGAVEKANTFAEHFETEIGYCEKVRDISTGQIIKSQLPELDFKDKVVLIPDDLCDGGFTFIKLAEQLKSAGAKQVDLYVTHLIASKGLDTFTGLIDNIYCYHTVGNYVNKEGVRIFNERS